jgi:hypothetical protein
LRPATHKPNDPGLTVTVDRNPADRRDWRIEANGLFDDHAGLRQPVGHSVDRRSDFAIQNV